VASPRRARRRALTARVVGGIAKIPYYRYSVIPMTRQAHALVEVSARGTITLPKRFRDANLYEIRPREGGGLELIPKRAIDASQAWFWTDRWQKMEREADADIRAGRIHQFESADNLISEIEKR
jgi:antitoxin MazE